MEQQFQFTTDIPLNYNGEIPVISGADSLAFNGKEYLILNNGSAVFEIRYEHSCSPFKEALVVNNILAVGHEGYFYLYDLNTKNSIFKFEANGYFGHLYLYNDIFYIADASGITAVNKIGELLWNNHSLAIDGVTINKFEDDKIYGSGELDPPGGWKDFIVDLVSGKIIT